MALSIKDPEADRLARVQRGRQVGLEAELLEIARRCAALPLLDDRVVDELLGYDEHGLPR